MVTYMRRQIVRKCHCCPSSAILDITGEKNCFISGEGCPLVVLDEIIHQCANKVSFTACHSGTWQLASTSPKRELYVRMVLQKMRFVLTADKMIQ